MLDIIKLSIVLTLVALAAGLAVALTNAKTAGEIEIQKQRAQNEALQAVFPEGVVIKNLKGEKPLLEEYWTAEKNGKLIGYAFKESSKGYAADIKIILGVDPQGKILGMKILSQSETPGLGTRVEEVVSNKYLWNGLVGPKEQIAPWFTEQFVGLNIKKDINIDKSEEYHTCSDTKKLELKSKNQVTAITGATISTKAVIKSITQAVPSYLNQLTTDEETE